MSLVEKTLQRLKESAKKPGASPLPSIFGTVISARDRRPVEPGPLPPANDKSVEINEDALRAAGLLPPKHEERQIAQQYRQIKRPLVSRALGRGTSRLESGDRIMMASALSGEGKTFTCINLAFSMALEADVHVLLVDADAPKPHISSLFGVSNEAGLLDLLRDSSLHPESLVMGTNVPNLSVLPAGKGAENATELFASNRMSEVLARLGERDPNRIILFDSPPLMLTTEARVLANLMGQIVVVVRAESTPQRTVLEALSHLVEGKSTSLLLNHSARAPDGGYYYGYNNNDSRDGPATGP